MKEELEKFIVSKLGKRPENIEMVLEAFTQIRTKKNEILVEEGEVCKKCYFIIEGCLKVITYNVNGDENTTNLAFEN